MSRLAIVLACASIALATSTIYFYKALQNEQHGKLSHEQTQVKCDALSCREVAPPATKIIENVPPPAKNLVRNEPLHSGGQLSGIKDFLKGMRDPQRSAVIRDTAIRLQRDWQRPVAKYIGLTEDDLTQLATLIADQRLQSQVALQSCKLDPTCKTDPQAQSDLETKLQLQIAQLLGPSKARSVRGVPEDGSRAR